MPIPVIELRNLTVYYGQRRGVEDLNLTVEPGEVFGFLGPNGAGKTTTLRVLLDIIRPTRGQALIFGRDCRREGPYIRRQVGYLPGELSLPANLTARQYLAMLDAARGRVVEAAYLARLCDQLDLDLDRPMRTYSRGNKQKVGLIAAFMVRPQLLILDEPTGGLDPLVQQTVLELVRAARAEGRTVFFSSHILPEVQAVCDRVGIIRAGRMVTVERVDALLQRQQVHRLRLRFAQPIPPAAFALPGVTELAHGESEVMLEVRENLALVLRIAGDLGAIELETMPLTLEEVFLAYYGAQGGTMLSLCWHELRARRGLIIGWGVGLVIFFGVYLTFYPALPADMRNLDLQAIELYRAFGNLTMATFEGYIGSTIFYFFSVLLAVLAIVTGTGLLAGEEDAGTLELQMALPLARWQLVTAKVLELAVIGLVVLAVAGLAAVGVFLAIRDQLTTPLDAGDLFRATIAHWPLVWLFQTLSLWLGTVTPSRRIALAIATVLLIVSFLGYNLVGMSPDLEWLRPLSPFHYRPVTPETLNDGPALSDLAILTVAALVCYGLAVISFDRRDVTVGAWPWVRWAGR